jgi:adenylate cyclase
MAARNEEVPEHRRMLFRIGINLGDVIHDEARIYGDGINIAARLEGLAEPGGVLVSQAVHDQVRDRLDLAFEDLGERELKNIARPVRVYRLRTAGKSKVAPVPGAALPMPDKPSIAVLPFTNMSGDPDQEHFADGIAEDILTGLARLRWLFVIARNSSFTYKGRHVDVRQVGRELGVRYVLEGSVRKGGNRIRITAQLIEAETGAHLWAERYDRTLDDVFAIQDEITDNVIACIQPQVYTA